jgi:hypothetical protein
VKVTNGILGSFGFDRNGDMDVNLLPISRVPAHPGDSSLYTVIKVRNL